MRTLELAVTDAATFAERESEATTHRVELVDPRALEYRQVSTARSGRYRITKTYVTDVDAPALLVQIRLESLDGGSYRGYVVFDPSLRNSGMGDSGATEGEALVGSEGDTASALVASPAFSRTSNGFAGVSDGWTDLRDDRRLDWTYTEAANGNVVQTGELASGETMLALAFGSSRAAALAAARSSLARGFADREAAYGEAWRQYLGALPTPGIPGDLRTQYTVAVMALRAHEDKTRLGAGVASLSIPWGDAVNADNSGVGGYHLVWARDLYQVATAQLAAGDREAAMRALRYLFDVQQNPDGSFPQNSNLDGTPVFASRQLDEVAFPLVLAWQLGGGNVPWRKLKRSADFLARSGPWTPQERWEEEAGYSPSTIAAEIAGLACAADLASRNRDRASADLYLGVADEWQRSVERLTFTTTGPLAGASYYERIDQSGNPNDAGALAINNGGGAWPEREVVDAGFLELVRLGVKPPADERIAQSLRTVDSQIRVETPNGRLWRRYNHDGYGENEDGSPYDGAGVGRLWPLLAGERGEYEVANGRSAEQQLRTMAGAANEGYLIPEQVWDRAEPTAFGFVFGEGTGSATPLAWSMAQFVRLAWGVSKGLVVERPEVVAERYASGAPPPSPSLRVRVRRAARIALVIGRTSGVRVAVDAPAIRASVPIRRGAFAAKIPLRRGANRIVVVAVDRGGGTRLRRASLVR